MDLVALLLRHGETELNKENLLKGILDTPLDKTGIEQAHDAAKFLAHFHIERHVTSPLRRAFETAMIVYEAIGVYPLQNRDLFPWDIGTDFMDVPKKTSGLIEYIENPDKIPPNGDSLNDTRERIHSFFSKELPKGVITLFTTHNSVITCLSELLQEEKGRKNLNPLLDSIIEPGGVIGIYHEKGAYVMSSLYEKVSE